MALQAVISDSFVDTVGTRLVDHTPTGSPNAFTWIHDEQLVDPTSSNGIEIGADGTFVQFGGPGADYADYVMPSTDYTLRAEMTFNDSTAFGTWGLWARRDILNNQGILARLRDDGRLFLVSRLADGSIELNTFTDVPGFVQVGSHTLDLEVTGSTIRVLVDDVEIFNETTALLTGDYVAYQVVGGGSGDGGTSFSALQEVEDTCFPTDYTCVSDPSSSAVAVADPSPVVSTEVSAGNRIVLDDSCIPQGTLE